MARDVHTVPNKAEGGGWVNVVGGIPVGPVFSRKEDAEAHGRELAKVEKHEHVIHRKDGVITEKNSYGPDPKSIKG